jgi:hypothetical protein
VICQREGDEPELTGLVTPTTLASVLSQKAYMLFYVKRSLAYGSRVVIDDTDGMVGASGKRTSGSVDPAGGNRLLAKPMNGHGHSGSGIVGA